jgi:putative methyltransferase
VFQAQEEHLLPKLEGKVYWSLYETSRGCPYRCSYCDWGGGTYTKTIKKPFATVLSELEWLSKNKCHTIALTDANFGIFDIDTTVAEYISEYHKKYGYPKRMHSENAKNHPERVAKITKIFALAGMLEGYRISIQSINDEIKKNIDRIDIPFKKQLNIFKELQSTIKNLPIKVETIMGLPGATVKSHLNEIDTILGAGLMVPRPSTWMLLPESPAYSPEYRKKFKIQTVNKYNMSWPWALKKNLGVDEGVYSMEQFYNLSVESVVGTYSYTKQDWISMQMINSIAKPLSIAGGKYLFKYMKEKHRMKPSVLIEMVLNLIYQTYEDRSINDFSYFYHTLDYYNEWIEKNSSPDSGIDHDVDFPIIFSAPNYTTWRTLINLPKINSIIKDLLIAKFNDKKIEDLLNFTTGITLDITYNPTKGRTITTQYDWLGYFQSKKRLIKSNTVYSISDQEIQMDISKTHKIDWHEYKHDIINFEKQYFYLMCTNIDLDKTSKSIEVL